MFWEYLLGLIILYLVACPPKWDLSIRLKEYFNDKKEK